jgi:putative RNA 2'-phosphotransferase
MNNVPNATAGPTDSEVSRAISHALRHEPWLYELEPDEEGWVELPQLVMGLQKHGANWAHLVEDDVVRAVERSDKRRHEIVDGKIRALYGHSRPGRLVKRPEIPPEVLFHGTSIKNANKIMEAGLLPMGRQYVHLSFDRETALTVGRRKSTEPVLLRVDASRAAAHGTSFYVGNDKVWLADTVPREFLTIDVSDE